MANLDLLHLTLSEIRKDRENAVTAYRAQYADIKEISLSQQSIDREVQIFHDRLTLGIEYSQILKILEQPQKLYGNPLIRFKAFLDLQDQYEPSLSLQFHNAYTCGRTYNEWISDWVNAGGEESSKDQRVSFKELLKDLKWESESIFPLSQRQSPIHLYEMKVRLLKCYYALFTNPFYEKSKETYEGYIRKIDELITKPFEKIAKLPRELTKDYGQSDQKSVKTPNIPLAAKFLRSLEEVALNSTSERTFRALLLSWAIILIPLPIRPMLNLPAPNEENSCIQLSHQQFSLPSSFIKFWKSFEEAKFLFPLSIRCWKNPEKRLNITIKRLGRRTELFTHLTPKMLRSVLSFRT